MSANEQIRSSSANGNGEGILGIPDDLRCKRSDGKQWRCTAKSMPDKTVCEKHYIQAKRRAANSAFRANQKKVKRRSSLGETDTISEGKIDDFELPITSIENYNNDQASASKDNGRIHKRHKSLMQYSPETTMMRSFSPRVAVDLNDELARDVGMFEEGYRSYRTPPSVAVMDPSRNRSHQSTSPMEYSAASTDVSAVFGGNLPSMPVETEIESFLASNAIKEPSSTLVYQQGTRRYHLKKLRKFALCVVVCVIANLACVLIIQ